MSEREKRSVPRPETEHIHDIHVLADTHIWFNNKNQPYSTWTLVEIGGLPFVTVCYRVGSDISDDNAWSVYKPYHPLEFHPPKHLPHISYNDKLLMLSRLGAKIKQRDDASVTDALKLQLDANADNYGVIYHDYDSNPAFKEKYHEIIVASCIRGVEAMRNPLAEKS